MKIQMQSSPARMSAGIICYMMTDAGPQIVLGREQHVKGWAGSLRWSEFGGNAGGADRRLPKLTAAREFFEESLGVLGDLGDALQEDRYSFHIVVRQTLRPGGRVKYYYVVEVPYDKTIKQRFHGRREHLKNILFSVARLREMQRALLELHLPVPDYAFEVNGVQNMVRRIDCVEKHSDGSSTVRYCTAGDAHGYAPDHLNSLLVSPSEASRYADLVALKNWLDRLIAGFPARLGEAAIVFKTRCGKRAWLPFVKKEFLEKDSVTFVDAKALCDNTLDLRVRRSFEMPLKLIAQQLIGTRN